RWRRPARDICDPRGAALPPAPPQQPDTSCEREVHAGRLEGAEVSRRSIPASLPAKDVCLVVDSPELARGPAERFANASEHLRCRLGPGCCAREWTGHGELHTSKPLGHPPLTDVGNECDKVDF